MKQHKLLFTALALVFAAGLLFAFAKPVKKEAKATQTIYWFHVDTNGNPTTVIGSDPSAVCPDDVGDLCAKAYYEEQTTGEGANRTVLEIEEPNAQDEAYLDETK